MIPSILIGSDPELFLMNPKGEYVSAHDLIPGSKHEPHRVKSGAIQPDGVAAEFNTDPAKTADEFIANIDQVIAQLEDTFKLVRPDLTIVMTPTATFTEEYFSTLPDIATVLGCTPDYNAYTMSENTPPETTEPFRTGSGHIHIGYAEDLNLNVENFTRASEVVKQLDTILYVHSLLWDSDDKRRTLYGKIGAFRPKSYGVEYRPLSNSYLKSKDIQRLVFDISKQATELYFEGVKLYEDKFCIETVERIRNGETLSSYHLAEYLLYMNETYELPVDKGMIWEATN